VTSDVHYLQPRETVERYYAIQIHASRHSYTLLMCGHHWAVTKKNVILSSWQA